MSPDKVVFRLPTGQRATGWTFLLLDDLTTPADSCLHSLYLPLPAEMRSSFLILIAGFVTLEA